MEEKSRNIAICLTILWIASFILAFFISLGLRINSILSDEVGMNMSSSIGAYLIIGLYFFPLLLQIKKYALLAKMEKLLKWVHSCLLLFTGTLVLFPIAYIIMILAN